MAHINIIRTICDQVPLKLAGDGERTLSFGQVIDAQLVAYARNHDRVQEVSLYFEPEEWAAMREDIAINPYYVNRYEHMMAIQREEAQPPKPVKRG